MKKWSPWSDPENGNASAVVATNDRAAITEPPCKHCAHFRPEVLWARHPQGQKADGVVICHATDMHRDFSCFKNREPAHASD